MGIQSKILVILAAAFIATVGALYSSSDDVISLTADNFRASVIDDDHVWIVEFYAPWCGYCKKLQPEYKKVATNLKGLVRVGAVDCDEDKNRPLCGAYNVQGFPTIKVFPSEQRGGGKTPIDYNGERTAKAIVDFAVDRIPHDNVKQLTSAATTKSKMNVDEFLAEKNETMNKAILFTSKDKTTPLYRALALDFKGGLVLAEVRKSEKKIVEKFGIEKFPTLIVLPKGETEAVIFSGSLSHEALTDFLLPYSSKKPSSGKKSGSKKKEPPKQEPFNPDVPEIFTQAELQKECLEKAETGYSVICFFAFLPPLEPEFPESVEQYNTFKNILKSLKKTFYDSSSTSSSLPRFEFLTMDGMSKTAQTWINKFGLSSDLPSMMMLSPSKKVYAPYIGGLDEDDIQKFLKDMSVGRGRLQKYNWELEVVEEKKNEATGKKEKASCGEDKKDNFGSDSGSCTMKPKETKNENNKKETKKKQSEERDEL